jgi:hypothetical protein
MKTRQLIALSATLLALSSSGCRAASTPRAGTASVGPSSVRLLIPGDTSGGGVIFRDIEGTSPYTIGDLPLCLSGAGSVVISAVTVTDPTGDIALDSFGTTPNEMEHGHDGVADGPGPITRIVSDPAKTRTVDAQCATVPGSTSAPGVYHTDMLVLQYHSTTGLSAGAKGVTIHYQSGGMSQTLSAVYGIMLCAAGDVTTSYCRP